MAVPLTMFDSVDVTEIPMDAKAVAGYVNGKWPTYWTLVTQFPHAEKVSIAVTADRDADCLDVERGDATPDEAPGWVKRQIARGVQRPIVYASVSRAPELLVILRLHGITRSKIRLWTAHYTHEHLCDYRCGLLKRADATQWTDRALGRNLDASLVGPTFFPSPKPVDKVALRHRLRAWVRRQRRAGATWAALKRAARWKLWRRLGGR